MILVKVALPVCIVGTRALHVRTYRLGSVAVCFGNRRFRLARRILTVLPMLKVEWRLIGGGAVALSASRSSPFCECTRFCVAVVLSLLWCNRFSKISI